MLFSLIGKIASGFDKSTNVFFEFGEDGNYFYRVSGFLAIKVKLDVDSGELKGFFSIPSTTDTFLLKSKLSTEDISVDGTLVKVQSGATVCEFELTPVSTFPYSIFFDSNGKTTTLSRLDVDMSKMKGVEYRVFGSQQDRFFFVSDEYIFSIPTTSTENSDSTSFLALQKSLLTVNGLGKIGIPTIHCIDTGELKNISITFDTMPDIQLVIPFETIPDDIIEATEGIISGLEVKDSLCQVMNFSAVIKTLSSVVSVELQLTEDEITLHTEQAEMKVDQFLDAIRIDVESEKILPIALEKLQLLCKFPHNKVDIYTTADEDTLCFKLDTGVELWV